MNTALLLSGGIGSRVPGEVPKQYFRICGRMMITYALDPLLISAYVDAVVIVAEPRWRDAILEDARKAGLSTGKISGFVIPGANRQCSILNGLEHILLQGNAVADRDTVLVHDAARPLLSGGLIEACYRALQGHDGVMPVLPMKDTVYLSRDGRQVDGLFERNHIYAGQAPELFLLKKYYQANRALVPEKIIEIKGSTEVAVMAGMDMVMIPGEERNFKITTEADLQRLQKCMGVEDEFAW